MTSDLDIYRSAKLLIDHHDEDAGLEAAQHGEDAATEAAMRADKMEG